MPEKFSTTSAELAPKGEPAFEHEKRAGARDWRKKRLLKKIATFLQEGVLIVGALGVTDAMRKERRETMPEERQKVESQADRGILDGLGRSVGTLAWTAEAKLGMAKTEVEVGDGLETADGRLSKENIEYFLKLLPRGWVDEQIKSIRNLQDKDYGEVKYAPGLQGAAAMTCNELTPAEIRFYKGSASYSLDEQIETLYHEVAHTNDWICNKHGWAMNFENRVDWRDKIVERITAEDRYRSPYVEKILAETADETMVRKIREYWAEICSVYFMRPMDLSAEDFAIVDAVVKKTDPDYNPFWAAYGRDLGEACVLAHKQIPGDLLQKLSGVPFADAEYIRKHIKNDSARPPHLHGKNNSPN